MCCVSHNGDGDDHGVRRADTARAHARWRYLVASHEATDMLYLLMCLTPYLPGGIVVAIVVDSVSLLGGPGDTLPPVFFSKKSGGKINSRTSKILVVIWSDRASKILPRRFLISPPPQRHRNQCKIGETMGRFPNPPTMELNDLATLKHKK